MKRPADCVELIVAEIIVGNSVEEEQEKKRPQNCIIEGLSLGHEGES